MNDKSGQNQDSYRELLLMSELEAGSTISQREIARRLGIAVGLVNNYLKNLATKGYVQVKAYPRNRFAYLLTPRGFAEKSRLAYQQVSYFHKLFRTFREDSLHLFTQLKNQGVAQVYFCGLDEFTETVFLSLQEAGIDLLGVLDSEKSGELFVNRRIDSFWDALPKGEFQIVITSFREVAIIQEKLIALGLPVEKIHSIRVPE